MCYLTFVAEKYEDPFIPESEPAGFFPPPQRKRPSFPFVANDTYRLPPIDGFIPNSMLISLLFPQKETVPELEESNSQATGLADSQVENVTQFVIPCLLILFIITCGNQVQVRKRENTGLRTYMKLISVNSKSE